MPSATHNKDLEKKLARQVPKSGVAGYRVLRPILLKLAQAVKLQLDVDGADVQEVEGGFHIRPTGLSTVSGSSFLMYCILADEQLIATSDTPQLYNTVAGNVLYMVVTSDTGTGSYDLTFTWDKDAVVVGSDSPGYAAVISSESSAGTYTCTVKYGAGDDDEVAISCAVTVS